MHRIVLIAAFFLALAFTPRPLAADEISDATDGVVRVLALAETEEGTSGSKGTGFAITPRVIVTNAHVVENAYYGSGRTIVAIVPPKAAKPVAARIIAFEPDKDMALLELEDGGIPVTLTVYDGMVQDGAQVTALGYPASVDRATDSDELKARSPVRAVGNFSNTDHINGIGTLLHTANINKGNSGGPLTDECGRVIGVNTFITNSANDGAAYSFAISTTELLAFLRRHGFNAATIGTECVTAAAAKVKQDAEEKEKRRRAEEAAKAAKELQDNQQSMTRQARIAGLQEQRENYMAAALVFFVLGAMAFGIYLYRQAQAREEAPARQKLTLATAIVLTLAAVGAFVLKPSLVPGPEAAAPTDTGSATPSEAVADAADSPAGAAQAHYTCELDQGRSFYQGEAGGSIPVNIDEEGCVNERTPYARTGSQTFQRLSILNDRDTLVRMTFDRGNRRFVKELWSADSASMSQARKLRDARLPKACGISAEQMPGMVAAQSEILSLMSSEPDERKVYACSED